MYTISDETADEDLPKQWEVIIARLNEKTGWDLNAKGTASIDSVILKITAPKDADPDKHANAKKVWRTTMKCVDRLGVFVQRFGAFVAQGASIVFGPANQCFNAINFVITAAQQYKDVFAKITTLMERISVFLENLSMFMDNNNAEVKLDKRLRKTAYRVLEHFVKVMGTTYDLTNSRRARLKLMASSFAFGEDEGVKDSLATLETLVSDFTGSQISVIVQDLSAAAKDIRGVDKKLDVLGEAAEKQTAILDQLAVTDASRKEQEKERKDRETIKKALGIDDSSNPWDRQAEHWESHIAGTGQWLLERPHFTKWADKSGTASEVIALKAPTGYGKSHLSSIVINHLQDKYRGDTRVVTAYYYVQRESSKRSSVVNRILKIILWQLARANKEYVKMAASVCDGLDTSRTAYTWKRLLTDLSKSLDATVFVVVDGLDELESAQDKPDFIDVVKQIRSVADDEASRLKVRAFVTGTCESLDPIIEDLKGVSISMPHIHLDANPESDTPSVNQMDLELFVGDRLSRNEQLKGLDDQLKERVKRELAKGARGAYSRLQYLVDDLMNIQNTSQIEDILARANQSLSAIITDKISALNNTLSRTEISELNTLLDWITVTSKQEDLNVAQCEIILSLRADGQSLGLEDRIRKKYSDIFSVDEAKCISLRAGVQEYLEQATDVTTNRPDTAPRAGSVIIPIEAGELALVKRLLSTHLRTTFGDDSIYSRFGFDDFFQDKLGDQALRIRLVRAESNVRVAQGCLLAVCERAGDARSEPFLKYAYGWLINNLDGVDLSATAPDTKQDMGRKLTRLLTDLSLIEKWWAHERIQLYQNFVYADFSRWLTNLIHVFLKDSGVLKGLTDMPTERQWVLQKTASDSPNFALYENIAKVMAKRWFNDDMASSDADEFDFLVGYMRSINGETPEKDDDISSAVILKVQSWTQEQLGNANLVASWHEVMARTFKTYRFFKKAIAEYRLAVGLQPTNWRLRLDLAEALGEADKYAEAVVIVEDVVKDYKHLIPTDEDFTAAYWDRILVAVGIYNLEIMNYATSEETYQQLLDHGVEQKTPTDATYRAIFNMLSVLNKQARYNEAMALIEKCSNQYDSQNNEWIKLSLQWYHINEYFHQHLLVAAKRSGMVSQVGSKYEQALYPNPSEADELARNMALRFYFARFLWNLGNHEQQHDALELWESVVNYESVKQFEEEFTWLRVSATLCLARALLSKTKQADTASSPAAEPDQYSQRLRTLSTVDFGDIAPLWDTPRLMLARRYQLSGQREKARDLSRNVMKDAFDMATAEGDSAGFYTVAVILQALEDDANALAAWSCYMPVDKDDDEDSEDDEEDDEDDSEDGGDYKESTVGESDGESHETQDTAPTEVGSEAQATGGAQEKPSAGAQADDAATEATSPDATLEKSSANRSKKKRLRGDLDIGCDGDCGHQWSYSDNFYACKDCVNVQFTPDCYQKLKAGELDVAICGKDHDHLYVPPFDEEAWRARPRDHIMLAGQSVPRSEWVEKIKRDWRIDDETLKMSDKAARTIQRAWRAHDARRQSSAWNAVLEGAGVFPKGSPAQP